MYLDDIEDDVIYTLADVESSFSIPKMKLIKCASLEERKIRLCIPLEQYHEVILINMNELLDPAIKSLANAHLAPQYEKFSNFKKVNQYQIKSAISIIIPLKKCVLYRSDLSLESHVFDEVYIQQSLDNNKNPIIRVITASEYASQLNLPISNPNYWRFAIYPLSIIPPQNVWGPKTNKISRDDLCIYGFELRRYLSELVSVESKKTEIKQVNKPKKEATRDNPFRLEMKAAIRYLIINKQEVNVVSIMEYFKSIMGKVGSVIIEVNNDEIVWKGKEHKNRKTSRKNLMSSFRYLENNNPELFNMDYYKTRYRDNKG